MSLRKSYPEDFERLYKAWPRLPVGRTVKYQAYKKFLACKKEFGFTNEDINELLECIETMKRERKSWQRGNPYGAKGMQSWFEKRLFLDDLEGNYETVKKAHRPALHAVAETETPEQIKLKLAEQEKRFEEARKQADRLREMKERGLR